MLVRTRKRRPSPLGVFSVSVLVLLNNFLCIDSFSTRIRRHVQLSRGTDMDCQYNYDATTLCSSRISGKFGNHHRNHKMLARSSQNTNDMERTPPSRRQNSNNTSNHTARKSKYNKYYKDRNEQRQRDRKRRELQNKLKRARDSLLYYGDKTTDDGDAKASMDLRMGLLPKIFQSYTEAMLQVSLPSSTESENDHLVAVWNLVDLWEHQNLLVSESRPVQDRILGLLAILMQMVTYMDEEYTLFLHGGTSNTTNKNNNSKRQTMPTSTQEALDHLGLLQSRLWKTSQQILKDMIEPNLEEGNTKLPTKKKAHVVSPMAVVGLARALRESTCTRGDSNRGAFGVEELQELMQLVDDTRKAAAATSSEEFQSDATAAAASLDRALEMAWNYYLSSLCDQALATKTPNHAGLETAANLVLQPNGTTTGNKIVDSNIVSYNTVLNIAAKVGNATLVDALWKDLTAKRVGGQASLEPNSRTYNARLMVTNNDTQRLEILDNEIIPAAFAYQRQRVNASASASMDSQFASDDFVLDSFTIDMVMMPLLQANRKKHLFQLIDHWMTLVNRQHNIHQVDLNEQQEKINHNKAQRAFKNAMSAFFITLVQWNGDVKTARELWNRYMVLTIDNSSESSTDKRDSNVHTDAFLRATNIVYPERRHFNILLDGYARLVEQARDQQTRSLDRTPENEKSARPAKIWEAAASYDSKDEMEDRDAQSTAEYYEEIQDKAIQDGQNLFAIMTAQQQRQNSKNFGPDAITRGTMIRLCRSGREVRNLLRKTTAASTNLKSDRIWLPRSVTRAAITTCGNLGDPSMACVIFDEFMFPGLDSNAQYNKSFSNFRAFNVLLGALASGAKLDNPRLDVLSQEKRSSTPSFLLSSVHGLTCTEAVICILNLMTAKNSQTYCVAASALQYAPIHERMSLAQASNTNTTTMEKVTPLALQIFHNATSDGIKTDGRLVNAIFRCYGDDITGALDGWKTHIRKATLALEQQKAAGESFRQKNRLAAYGGLLYVCGRAERPDIAVRIVYAMKNKEGLDPSEIPYNNYRSGKTDRTRLVEQGDKEETSSSRWRGLLPKIDMVGQYENILYVECKNYDAYDKRTEKDNRIRIIV